VAWREWLIVGASAAVVLLAAGWWLRTGDFGDPHSSARATAATTGQSVASSNSIQPPDFQWLPAAATMPSFESGTIVRVEIPAALLHVYGLEAMPEARPVVADVLVGQDGWPRAIRLAGTGDRP
jgi:hypothetical protein